jgi:hypothetical protein
MHIHPINEKEENRGLLDLMHENNCFSILGEKLYGCLLLLAILKESNTFNADPAVGTLQILPMQSYTELDSGLLPALPLVKTRKFHLISFYKKSNQV